MNLNVEIRGTGYPILCLHGHPGSADSMSVFTEVLSQKYQTIAPDLRGYGKSRYRKNFVMEEHLEDLQKLLARYQIEDCLLLGWSLGGILALELAIRETKRFKGLILVASAAAPRSDHPPITRWDLTYTGIAGIINYLQPGWLWNINHFGKRSLFRYLVAQETPEAYQYLARYGVPAYFKTSAAANRTLSKAIRHGYNRLDELEKIAIPCLVLAGEYDRHITADSSRKTAQQLKNSQFICYPNTAHLFPWEIPQQVLQDVQEWLMANGFLENI
ncbi:MAG: alpha/beta fold hydrolase [Xenococcus sp. (in: cyanobacteria)]